MGLDVVEEAQQCAAAVAPVALDISEDNTGLAAWASDQCSVATNEGDQLIALERGDQRVDVSAPPDIPCHRPPVTSELCSEIRRHLESISMDSCKELVCYRGDAQLFNKRGFGFQFF